MTILNTIDIKERTDRTNEQETSVISSQKTYVENAGEVRDDPPGLSNIECKNPFCQMCHGIGDKE